MDIHSAVNLRLLEFLELNDVGNNQFAASINVSKSYLAGLRNGSAMGVDKLLDIITAYPELNYHWLLFGEGPMLKSKVPDSSDAERIRNLQIEIEALKSALYEVGRGLSESTKL